MTHSAIAVYERNPIKTIFDAGGSQAWVLNRTKARKVKYVVLCFNPSVEGAKDTLDQGAAFLIGKISRVAPSPEIPGRWIVLFDEYAEVNQPNVWGGWRNPVRYTSLEDLGVDIATLKFQPMPKKAVSSPDIALPTGKNPLTIKAAKAGLALTFGVKPEAVEITIRG